ncbi:MAG TPA: hypothetical protein VEO53_16465, partial [Candidatus Binatia bacterium]|nr:hypothetical protein [Candidatus Binatia bacterium]
MKHLSRVLRQALLARGAALVVFASTVVCAAPPAELLDQTHHGVKAAMALQSAITPDLMKWPEVLGSAVGLNEAGQLALVVFVDRDGASHKDVIQALPPALGGIPVRAELTDKIRAFAGKPGGGNVGISHSARQTAPIYLGTSGGWRYDLANGYCCGGTLGSLIQVNGVQYILSNYHVFESDIVSGGNNLIASDGNPVIQPGLIDVRCNANSAQDIGTLVKISALPYSNVDAAIAQAIPGMVRPDGAILEIGPLSSQTVAVFLNQAVKKSGRTTGLTRSKVVGLNATILVAYENECAGGAAFTKTYTGQIVMANNGTKFLNSGDSGSLLVEDTATTPRAAGLLYAGSSTSAIANPIGEVLQYIGSMLGGTATMVG